MTAADNRGAAVAQAYQRSRYHDGRSLPRLLQRDSGHDAAVLSDLMGAFPPSSVRTEPRSAAPP